MPLSSQPCATLNSLEYLRKTNTLNLGDHSKVLIANRGADESYQIGEQGQYTPVGAYLAQDEIIAIAKNHGATMVHPGYGFLSENAEFARKVIAAGMAF
ncbi:pyruvate carboxylase, partial [Dispira simplex]